MVATPPKQHTVTFKLDAAAEPTLESSSSPVGKSPRAGELTRQTNTINYEKSLFSVITSSFIHLDYGWIQTQGRGKAKLSSPAMKQLDDGKRLTDKRSRKDEESTVDVTPVAVCSPLSSPISRSPLKGGQNFCSYLKGFSEVEVSRA